jgi:hypothetical protein
MSRERERITRKREANPIIECNKIVKRFYPSLFERFQEVRDPRNSSYITYDCREMLGTIYYKGIAGISGMQEMTRAFNHETVVENLYQFMNGGAHEYLPHGVTINEFLERLDPKELENIQKDIVYQMIRRKSFEQAKVMGKWLVLIDGTELDEGFRQRNENYLTRTYHRGEENEYTKYHRSVLEAKIYFGNNLVCSLATETIENSQEYIHQSEEEIKQDCERKAFVRLSAKIKKNFPRLPICIVADGLYVSRGVMEICKKYDWDYIIRYKEGCASTIAEEYEGMPEKQGIKGIKYVNGVVYYEYDINVIHYSENKGQNGEIKRTDFVWITSIQITDRNAEKIVRAGRCRWKIENQGFNRQKRWQGNIEHACSFHERAQKNHYLLEQISDFIKQLYEYFYLAKNEIKKTQKNISSDLLASFGRQLTREDISQNDMQSISTT